MEATLNYRICGELRTQVGETFSALEDDRGREMIEHEETLHNDLTSVRHAREQLRKTMVSHQEDIKDTAVLLISEVVTNALLYTEGEVVLKIKTLPSWVRVEVTDQSDDTPRIRKTTVHSTGGRGLELVEMLSDSWGIRPELKGKTVWFELMEETADDKISIILDDAPNLLVLQTLENANDLIREITVFSEEVDHRELAVFNQIKLDELSETARDALEKGFEKSQLTVEVDAEAANAARELLKTLEEADQAAARGELLNTEATKDIKNCRRWILKEIARQTAAQLPLQRNNVEENVKVS